MAGDRVLLADRLALLAAGREGAAPFRFELLAFFRRKRREVEREVALDGMGLARRRRVDRIDRRGRVARGVAAGRVAARPPARANSIVMSARSEIVGDLRCGPLLVASAGTSVGGQFRQAVDRGGESLASFDSIRSRSIESSVVVCRLARLVEQLLVFERPLGDRAHHACRNLRSDPPRSEAASSSCWQAWQNRMADRGTGKCGAALAETAETRSLGSYCSRDRRRRNSQPAGRGSGRVESAGATATSGPAEPPPGGFVGLGQGLVDPPRPGLGGQSGSGRQGDKERGRQGDLRRPPRPARFRRIPPCLHGLRVSLSRIVRPAGTGSRFGFSSSGTASVAASPASSSPVGGRSRVPSESSETSITRPRRTSTSITSRSRIVFGADEVDAVLAVGERLEERPQVDEGLVLDLEAFALGAVGIDDPQLEIALGRGRDFAAAAAEIGNLQRLPAAI